MKMLTVIVSDGVFTFQVQLHSNGVIKFLYKEVS